MVDRELILAAFGRRVRESREQRELSQEALADLCGLHRTYVGSLERGERNVGLVNIYVLAAALRVPPGDLLVQVPVAAAEGLDQDAGPGLASVEETAQRRTGGART